MLTHINTVNVTVNDGQKVQLLQQIPLQAMYQYIATKIHPLDLTFFNGDISR